MKRFVEWLNKKGMSTELFVVILLIVGLAIAIIIFLTFGQKSSGVLNQSFNLTTPLKEGSGL